MWVMGSARCDGISKGDCEEVLDWRGSFRVQHCTCQKFILKTAGQNLAIRGINWDLRVILESEHISNHSAPGKHGVLFIEKGFVGWGAVVAVAVSTLLLLH